MSRWLWFAPFGALVVALAAWGFRLGWIAATLTETDVIEAYTAVYLDTAGPAARATDCVARPGRDRAVWIVVTCQVADGQRYDYPVNRYGRLISVAPAPDTPGAPQT